MKQSRYTDSQIISILKQAEAGTPVPETLVPDYADTVTALIVA